MRFDIYMIEWKAVSRLEALHTFTGVFTFDDLDLCSGLWVVSTMSTY